jgi:D-alanyl-D-alanine dipeptidase
MLDILAGRSGALPPRPVASPRPEVAPRDDFAPTLADAVRPARAARTARSAPPVRTVADASRPASLDDAHRRLRLPDARPDATPDTRAAARDDGTSIAPRVEEATGDQGDALVPEMASPIAPVEPPITAQIPDVDLLSPIGRPDDADIEGEGFPPISLPDTPPDGEPIVTSLPDLLVAASLPAPIVRVEATPEAPRESAEPMTAEGEAPVGAAPSEAVMHETMPMVASTIEPAPHALVAAPAPAPMPQAAAPEPLAAPVRDDRALAGAAARLDAAARSEQAALDAALGVIAPDAAVGESRRAARAGGVAGSRAVRKELDLLAPEFRAKLERVIERMEAEFGHDVTVTETLRSQTRQDALYAQGRTAEGPVVTWTRHSRHTHGMAADLLVDGSYDNAVGYAHLAQVAREEGLRTLGPRDPGHVELPTGAGLASTTVDALLAEAAPAARTQWTRVVEPAAAAPSDGLARVADVAQVARVAKPAEVARVAEVAEPGRAVAREESAPLAGVAPTAVAAVAPASLADGIAAPRTAGGVEAMERVTRLLDLQATQGARPLNGVLLRMERGDGVQDLVRVGLRGTAADVSLGIGDPVQASAMGARIDELRTALERRGLAAEGVQVQATRSVDRTEWSGAVTQAPEVTALRALTDAALSQQQGGRDAEAQRRQFQQDQPFAQGREERRPGARADGEDARRNPRRTPQEDRQ